MGNKIESILVNFSSFNKGQFSYLLLGIVFLVSCTEVDKTVQKKEQIVKTQTSNQSQKTVVKKMDQFVLATSGLNLRTTSNPQSPVITKVDYGETVIIKEEKKGNSFKVDNIDGHMIQVEYKDKIGFLFSGYLSNIPAPDIEQEYRDSMLLAYDALLSKKEVDYKFTLDNKQEETTLQCVFVLPVQSYETAFLISKRLFYIPEEYNFPAKDEVVLSSIDEPSKAVERSPYDYVDHSFKITRDSNQEISSLKYLNTNEVASQEITIRKVAKGFKIEMIDRGK